MSAKIILMDHGQPELAIIKIQLFCLFWDVSAMTWIMIIIFYFVIITTHAVSQYTSSPEQVDNNNIIPYYGIK